MINRWTNYIKQPVTQWYIYSCVLLTVLIAGMIHAIWTDNTNHEFMWAGFFIGCWSSQVWSQLRTKAESFILQETHKEEST